MALTFCYEEERSLSRRASGGENFKRSQYNRIASRAQKIDKKKKKDTCTKKSIP